MSKKYIIQWKSKVNGRAGRGTKVFARDEGEELVQELNRDYPDIQHELVSVENRNPTMETEPEAEALHEENETPAEHAPQVISFDA